ncbi:MAG: DUF3467 domain-containing protein [Firmicutes bacterium]|nr:DUF3467 domain-containing protein [Bacillota bacterium]
METEGSRPPRFYINYANVYAAPFDVVVETGEKRPARDEPRVVCELVMSPQMAKVLARLLTVSVEQWEAKHGEIRLEGQFTHGPTGPKVQPA